MNDHMASEIIADKYRGQNVPVKSDPRSACEHEEEEEKEEEEYLYT